MDSPYLRRVKKRNLGHAGREAEARLAKRVKGELRMGSGNKEGHKGDVLLDNVLIENKSTIHDSITIQLEYLLKIYQEALELNKRPALTIQFTTMTGLSAKRGRWVMIPEAHFQELIDGS